jgi:hypothetical protein
MVKLEYLVPQMDIIQFDAEDVITASGGGLDFGGNLDDPDKGNTGDNIGAGELFP